MKKYNPYLIIRYDTATKMCAMHVETFYMWLKTFRDLNKDLSKEQQEMTIKTIENFFGEAFEE